MRFSMSDSGTGAEAERAESASAKREKARKETIVAKSNSSRVKCSRWVESEAETLIERSTLVRVGEW